MNGPHMKYVLIGGGLASSSAMQAIRERDAEGSLLLVGQEVNRPYHRPPLSKEYLLGSKGQGDLFTLEAGWFQEHRVELRTGRRATRLDVARQTVVLDSGEEIGFDKLLIATGSSPRVLAIPGAELPSVYYLRTVEDAERLHHAIEKARQEGRSQERGKGRGRAGVIGGGLLGVELAATLTRLGVEVELVMAMGHPWWKFAGEAAGRFVARYLESRGVGVHVQTVPARLEGDGRVQRVVTSSGKVLPVDFVVPAMGVDPNRQLLRGTAIAAEKAILVDEHCRTNVPDIYAAGDCAAVLDQRFGKYRLLDHWESAMETGAIAGRNMAGGDERYEKVGHFSSEALGLTMSVWGEPRVVSHRIVRGNTSLDGADFVEIGVGSDGRVAEVMAINHRGEDALLREMVERRVNVSGREGMVRDPGVGLAELMK